VVMRLVAFDLDDTLYPERRYVYDGFRKVGRFMKTELGIVGGYQKLLKTFKENRQAPTIDTTLSHLDVAWDEELIQNMLRVYHSLPLRIRPYKDTVATLKKLSDQFVLVLITDGLVEIQQNKVRALGIGDFFDELVYTDAFGIENRKPSDFSFRKVMSRFSLSGYDCVYIGDNPTKDFISPNH